MALLDPLPAVPQTSPTTPSGVLPEQRVVVRHLPERRRFVLEVGVRAAGFAEYFETADRRVFVHTEVGQAFSGRGLAALLLRRSVEATTAEGLTVAAVCPFARRWLAARGTVDELLEGPGAEA